jgi:uncharacterized membrane protein YciS (DUF1049 family)
MSTLLTVLLIISLIVSALYVGLNYRNSKLCYSDEGKAKQRQIEPCMPQTPIPKAHKVAYVRDAVIAIVFLVGIIYLVWKWIN